MASPMPRPQKHPRTGVYWFRQRVPEDVRKLVGRREVTRTLGTKSLAEAKALHAAVAEEYAVRWANLRLGTQSATHRTIQALAGEFYREHVEAHDDDPGSAEALRAQLATDRLISEGRCRRPAALIGRFLEEADAFLKSRGMVFSVADRIRFATAISRAKVQAVAHTLAKAEGDYRPDADAARFPSRDAPARADDGKKSFDVYWDKYVSGRELAPKTVRRFHPIMRGLMAFVRTDDIAAVTEADLIRWRDHLEGSKKLSPRSIKNGQLAAAKAFFGWAHFKNHIGSNPCLNVRVDAKIKKKSTKMRGFTDAEAKLILSATLAQPGRLVTPEHAAARRWVPWICAYTGARVNEITQLRTEDILIDAACWAIVITPDAGTVKDKEVRHVPLHSHLVEQGFLTYVKSRPSGPLFYSTTRKRKEAARPQYETMGAKLAEWVRDLGISDPLVYPNHGWRHRVKTLRRRYGMDKEITDAIQGHAPATEGDAYGESELPAMFREIMKIPRYEVDVMPTTDRRRKAVPVTA